MKYSVQYYQDVKTNPDFRYEPEFFLPKYLEQEQKLLKLDTIPLKDCATFSNGRGFDSHEFSLDGDVHISKIGDVTQKRDYHQWDLITIDHFESLGAGYLIHNDILMTLTGDPPDVGKVQLIYDPPKNKLSWNQRVALLRLKKQGNISSAEYLFAALSSKYCREHIERWAKGIRQRNVGYPAVLNMAIPILLEIQNYITHTIQNSFSLLKVSKQIYTEAQTILLAELGLTDWQPKHRLTFVKNFSDTKSAERIDAEYFQPKYDEIEQGIKTYSDKLNKVSKKIRDEFKQNKSTFEVDPEKLYRYVEIGSVNVSTGGIVAEEVLGKDLPANAKRVLKKGDIIVSKVRTYRGAITIVQEDGFVGSGAFCVLRENGQISKETLLACFRSKLFLTWSWKPNTGTSYPTLSDDDILDFCVPILPKGKQAEIQEKVDESFNLHKHAEDLLEHAKHAVEIAIKQNEQSAINYLESVVETP